MEKSFKWDSEDYARHSTAQLGWANELIGKLKLKGDESLLDIGCGDGKITAALASKLPNGSVVGIDSSLEMIEHAKKSFPRDEYPNLSFEVMDARDMEFPSKFDVIFSNAALHWVSDHRPVLSGMMENLKDSGRILVQMGGKGNAEEIMHALEKVMNQKKWKSFFKSFSFRYGFYDVKEYTALLKEAGLKPVRVELIPKDMAQKGREGLAGWIRTTWLPYLERVQDDRKEEFVKAVIDEYQRKHPIDKKGLIHVNMMRLEVEAERKT